MHIFRKLFFTTVSGVHVQRPIQNQSTILTIYGLITLIKVDICNKNEDEGYDDEE